MPPARRMRGPPNIRMLVAVFDPAKWFVAHGVNVIGIALGALVLVVLLRALTRRVVVLASSETLAAKTREQQTRTLASMANSTGTVLIVALAVTMILREFGLDITPILAGAGLVGIAIGFGAQSLVRDILNGFFIALEDQYAIGDTVKIGEVSGRVERITLRRTLIRSDDGALHTLPNGDIRAVANLTRDWSQLVVSIHVADRARWERVFASITDAVADLQRHPTIAPTLMEPPRVLGIEKFLPTGFVIQIQLRTQVRKQWDAARELRRLVKANFERDHIPLGPEFPVVA